MIDPYDYVRFQIALDDTPFTASPTWTDFTTVVRAASWELGRTSATESHRPGTATITVDNQDGRWDPSFSGAPSPYTGKLKRWLGVRVLASNDAFSTSTVLWRGFLWDAQNGSTDHDADTVLTCTDQLGILANHNLEDLERVSELSGVRAQAIFADADLIAGMTNIAHDGTVPMGEATLTGTAFAAVLECARTEGGAVYCGRDGRINYTDRHYFTEKAVSNFALDDADIKYMRIPQGLGRFENVQQASSSGISGRVYKFGTTEAGFPRAVRREMNTIAYWDADARVLARWLRRNSAGAGPRVEAVTCDVLRVGSTTVLDGLVDETLAFLDTVTITYEPFYRDADVTFNGWVDVERHSTSRDGRWELELEFSPRDTLWYQDSPDFLQFGETITSALEPGY